MTIVVGGVGELYQGDLDAGRVLADRLRGHVEPHVVVEELHYGALAVSQMLEDVQPDALVLVGATPRGDTPGTVRRTRVRDPAPSPEAAQRAVTQAATGYVDIDLIVTVCAALGSLPDRTVVIEVEPEATGGPIDVLSPTVTTALDDVEGRVHHELRHLPLLVLADRIHDRLAGEHLSPAPAVDSLNEVLTGLDVFEETGHWSTVFRSRDRLRLHIAAGETGEGMDHLDWSLWWNLIEELDRLEGVDLDTVG